MTTRRLRPCNTPECRRMRALLSDFLDHSLHWRTARSLEAHLVACPPCAVFVASVERTITLYRERPVVDVPPAVRGHLRDLLRERHEAAPGKLAGKRAGRGCAGAVAAPARTAKAGVKSAPKRTAKVTAKARKAPAATTRKSGRP